MSHSHFAFRAVTSACLLGLGPLVVLAQSPAAPTHSQDAETIAKQWQQASSKYDGERNRILHEVTTVGHDGTFKPDWGSLSQWQVPEWYKDAKFGIFIHWGLYSVPAFGSDLIFFDWLIGQPYVRPYLAQFASYYYNESIKHGDPSEIVNYKFVDMQDHSGLLDIERGQLSSIRPEVWQTDTTVSMRSSLAGPQAAVPSSTLWEQAV
jgi:hypothetical protein